MHKVQGSGMGHAGFWAVWGAVAGVTAAHVVSLLVHCIISSRTSAHVNVLLCSNKLPCCVMFYNLQACWHIRSHIRSLALHNSLCILILAGAPTSCTRTWTHGTRCCHQTWQQCQPGKPP